MPAIRGGDNETRVSGMTLIIGGGLMVSAAIMPCGYQRSGAFDSDVRAKPVFL